MTERKHLKARVRERMARTGEAYVTARRHVVAAAGAAGATEPPGELGGGYRLRGGTHPDTASIANVLANLGVTAPHTGEPLTEAMALGAGGGLGAGYILWEFEAHHTRVVVLGFRNQWQYPDRWAAKVIDRLGLDAEMRHTGGARTAATELDAALDQGDPAIVWVDLQLMGYWGLPAFMEGRGGYPVVVHGADGDRVRIDDRNLAPLSVPRSALDAARSRVGSYRHRLIRIAGAGPARTLDGDRLRAAVLDGIADCAEHLAKPSDSFSLPAWRKWSRLLTDTRNAKAWPRVFADPTGLVGALISTYEGVEPIGTNGGNLRTLHAEFLDEAAGLLDRPDLAKIAGAFRDVAAAWHELAEAALPIAEPDLAAIRGLLAELHASVIGEGDAGAGDAAAAATRLWELRGKYRLTAPFDADARIELFRDLGGRLGVIYDAETAAVADLARASRAG
jgi:hypothetical protein